MADRPNRVGQQLGNYHLTGLLGEGGFAEVYLGEHIHLGTKAAVKVLHTQLTSDNVDQFRTEARTIAHLAHPHIVRVLDFGVEERIPFLVMDYAPNGTLRKLHPKGSSLPITTIVTYIKQVADALQYAHDEKLIHRDTKPENMLVGRHNEVFLSDFGIALVAQSSRYQSTQAVIGTLAYMSPEQIQGKPRPASDQYSLGIVVYEWLCGDRPFHGSFIELCTQHMIALPPPLHEKMPTVSPDIEHIVMTALAKDPKQRFASVQAFATALEQASKPGRSLPALPPGGVNLSNQPSSASVLVTPPNPSSEPISHVSPPNRSSVSEQASWSGQNQPSVSLRGATSSSQPLSPNTLITAPNRSPEPTKGPSVLGWLRFLTGSLASNTYPITKTITTLGRDPSNDIIIPDPSISRHHAQIIWENSSWSIKKLVAQNTLTVNQLDLPESPLNDRDTVGLGPVTIIFFLTDNQGQTQHALEPSQIQANNLANQINSPSLEVSTNTDHDKHVFPLTPDRQVFDIGRDPSNTIVISRPTVSSFHAQIIRDGNQLVLIHPHPSRGHTLNGLTYQGKTISSNEQFRHVLSRGDVFRISDENGTFVTLTYNDGSGMAQEILPEIRPIPLGAPVITIGRAPDNTVVLNHPQVSGYHARLEQGRGGYRIIDAGSTNHVYVNAQRIHTHDLKPGDEIRIGPFKLIYTGTQLTQHDESSSIRIDALRLKRTGNKNAILINDISVAIPPRKFVALVGGSGAGKSTLMNALNGIRPAQSGVVFYNGQDYYHHLAAFSTQLGYVPQDDIIHRDLSVERALYYAAKLRLPQDFTAKQIKERIDEVLEDVEMKYRRHLLISKLSGGQRKRVSIALELLANPSVFFLDEPTSGLDPGLDRKMMLLLRKLADKGHTIVLVTHATNNINACDYICFLCQGGRLAYYGPPNEAKAYFGKADFAEIYTALELTDENPNAPAEAEARFKQSADYQHYVIEPLQQGPAGRVNLNTQTAQITPPKRGNPWKQFILLSMRYLELIFNDRVNLAILFLQAPIIGIILFFLIAPATFAPSSIATCFAHQSIATNTGPIVLTNCQQVIDTINLSQAPNGDQLLNQSIGPGSGGDAQKILFIMAFAAVMFGCINGAREIVKEAAIYQRERTVNLGIIPYLFSKIFILGIFSLLQSFILVFLVNLKEPLSQLDGNSILFSPFVEIYISMALTALAGLMTGLLISAIVPNNDRAMSLIPLPLLPQVIFAGVIFSLDKPPFLQVLGAFFAARWSMAAMGSTVGLHGDKLAADSFSYLGILFTHIDPNQGHPAAAFHLILCWIVLTVMIVVQGFVITWLLKRKDIRR